MSSTSSWSFDEPFAKAIDDIAAQLNRVSEAPKWKSVLEQNAFDTVGSLQVLNSFDWTSMGIPLRVLIELRKSTVQNPENKVPKEKNLQVAEKKRFSKSKLNNNNNIIQANNILVSSNGNNPEIKPHLNLPGTPYPELTHFFAPPNIGKSGRKDSTSAKARKKSATKEKIKCVINLVGKDKYPTFLLQQMAGSEADIDNFATQVNIHNELIDVEFHDAMKIRAEKPNIVILLFSKINLIKCLTEVNEKVQLALSQLKSFQYPLFLVSYDPDFKRNLENRMDWIRDLLDQIKPVKLIDIKSPEDVKDLISECAYYTLRNSDLTANKVEIQGKIQKAIDKKSTELSFKKSSLHILPNSIFGVTGFINKLSLESNLFKFFPIEVLEMEHLQELNLSGNQIEEVPHQIKKLKHLLKLDLENNNIETLPIQSLQEMKALQDLKVKTNPLSKLPDEIKSKSDILLAIRQYVEKPTDAEKLPESERFKIFGVSLQELMGNETRVNPSATIPRFVRHSINFIIKFGLDQEGVFRLAGQNVQCAQLKEDLDKGNIVSFQDSEYVHNVTSLLKQWLRELPEPLFLFSNYQSLISLSDLDNESIVGVNKILAELPIYNYYILRAIFRVMYFVARNSEVNRMDAGNVAKVVGPNLIYSQHPKDPLETMSDINRLNDILTYITINFPIFFETDINLFEYENLSNNKIAILYRVAYGHEKSVIGTVVTSDFKSLWSADSKGVLRLSTTKDLSLVKEIDISAKKRINCITLCHDKVWVGFLDSLEVRDELTGDLIKEINNPHTFNFTTIDGNVWVGDAGKIIVYDGVTFESQEIPTNCVILSLTQVNNNVWGACADKKIRIWSINSKEQLHELECSQGKLNALSFINGRIWSCADDASICVWDVEKLEVIEKLENKHTSKVFGAVKVGNHAWTYSWDGIRVYDCESFKYIGDVLSYHHDAIGSIESFFDESLNSHKVFTGSWDKSVICWLVNPSN